MAPLPRAYQWADGSAFLNHVELVRQSRGAPVPESFSTDPLMYQGGSDDFLGPCDPVVCRDESHGIDFEADNAETLSGYLIHKHEGIPKVREVIHLSHFDAEILIVSDTRIEKVKLTIH